MKFQIIAVIWRDGAANRCTADLRSALLDQAEPGGYAVCSCPALAL